MGKVIENGLVNQPTAAPTNKLQAVGASGALSIVLVYVLRQFGIELPVEVAMAATLLIQLVAGYWVKNKVV